MSDVAISVSGLPEVQRALYQYSQRLGDTVILRALREGAKVTQKAARSLSPRKTGNLSKGIVIKNSKIHSAKKRTNMIGVYLTIRAKKKTDPYYGRFQEGGWNTHGKLNTLRLTIGRNGIRSTRRGIGSSRITGPGKTNVPPKRFIHGAFVSTQFRAAQVIINSATAGAEVLARKVNL